MTHCRFNCYRGPNSARQPSNLEKTNGILEKLTFGSEKVTDMRVESACAAIV
jgi:hypothetical protein